MRDCVAARGFRLGQCRPGDATVCGGSARLATDIAGVLWREGALIYFGMHDSLYFSDHHLQVREMVRDFAKTVVKPTARQYDLESRFPWDHVKQMAELGLFGIPWPEGLGGSGMDYLSYITVIHELAKIDSSHAITNSAHTTIGTSPTPNTTTAIVVTKDTCDLEETKRVGIGHANSSDLPKCRGVLSGKKEDKLGWRASDTRELIFQDAIVPKENVLGPVNNGFRQFLHTLEGGRIGIAALSLGLAEGALEECLTYTSTRKQFGRPIASFQGVHFALADMATEIEAAKQLVYHAAWLKQHGHPFKKEAAMAKLYASELSMRATTKAVQLHGGY